MQTRTWEVQGLTHQEELDRSPNKTPLKATSSPFFSSCPAFSPTPTGEGPCSVTRTEEMEIGKPTLSLCRGSWGHD